ncbi:MAG TPA: hypothetical protein VF723_11370 [Pyrinomonadaceae bacterium]|jgi:hypothetical protein
MPVENQGNLVTRRAFAQRDGVKLRRIELLAEITQKSGATAYKMTEEMGLFGSGSPSPLYVLCELIRAIEEIEQREGVEFSSALEMAEYPRRFLRALRGEAGCDVEASGKLKVLIKSAADANFLLDGRELKDLNLGELKDFRELTMNGATLAHELAVMVDRQIEDADSRYRGTPTMRERPYRVASSEG